MSVSCMGTNPQEVVCRRPDPVSTPCVGSCILQCETHQVYGSTLQPFHGFCVRRGSYACIQAAKPLTYHPALIEASSITMKIAIIGQQDFGKAVLEAFTARGDTVAAIFCAPDRPGARPDALHAAAVAAGLPVFQFASLRSAEAAAAMRGIDVDLAVMAYVLQFAPATLLNIPRHGTIQYHPSLLPKHRGPSSINWPIAMGATETGLTIFRPTDGLDEGPVIVQKKCAIGPDDTLGDVYFKHLFPSGVAALLEAADAVLAGTHRQVEQDETQASYEGWFRDDEAKINWANSVDQVYNLIRAANPAPGAWCMLGGVKVRLFDCRKHVQRTFGAARGHPGEISRLTDDSVFINAQGGQIEVLRLKPDGGQKVSAAEFARTHGLVSAA
jgi:methionyl-tRNA formyltransferase